METEGERKALGGEKGLERGDKCKPAYWLDEKLSRGDVSVGRSK